LKKRIYLLIISFLSTLSAFATHIAGGEIYYKYKSSSASGDIYTVTVRLYRECNSVGVPLSGEVVTIGIYNNPGLTLNKTALLPGRWSGAPPQIQNDPNANPCLLPPITVCYQIGIFEDDVELPKTANGYLISWIRYTRTGLDNASPGNGLGATFTTLIPGTDALPSGTNTCPTFVVKDTTVICKSTSFTLDYGASDADGDSLAFKFVPAYDGFSGSASNPNPPPPGNLQLVPINYAAPIYTGTSPLGSAATINPRTGLISGTAPTAPGKYVICVEAEEWRNGKLINKHRKDFIVTVGDCGLNSAALSPDAFSCKGFTWNFQNQSQSSNIISYLWSFGDGGSSTQPTPTYTYKDTGDFKIKLKVTGNGGCQDSAEQTLHVFPGFFPNFGFVGACKGVPYQFNDSTRTIYGVVSAWNWDFGDASTLADTSNVKNPQFTFNTSGPRLVSLIVNNSKGCIDTAFKTVNVLDKPVLTLGFKDTLICSIDTLQLQAAGLGNFSWTPTTRMINPTSATPLVNPLTTTTYQVTLNDRGCLTTDTVRVNVLDFITVNAGRDTTICLTDAITLRPVSQALSYKWTPIATLTNPNTKNPIALPTATTTTYTVTGNLGKCQDVDNVTITTVPYPQATAFGDTTICFGSSAILVGQPVGSIFSWSPAGLVSNPNSLITQAKPSQDTWFYFTVRDVLGCPKPVKDSVFIKVTPPIIVNAGNDTTLVYGQPFTFQASASTAATIYRWTPATALSSTTILQPKAVYNAGTLPNGVDTISYRLTATSPAGCSASDVVVIKIYKVPPTIFVPSGFTPNGDGKNEIIKPILVGMQRLDYFKVFNRYGQLVFSTNQIDKGWDGRIKGEIQQTGAFVYAVQAIDFNGVVQKAKGTFTLIQ
jgi:gliding motility-associated-like protein